MAASLDLFIPLVAGKTPGCPDMIRREAIRASCIDFCRRTRLLIEDALVEVIAGNRFADLYPDDGQTFIVDALRREDRDLERCSRHDFARRRLDVTHGTPTAFYLEGDWRLVLGPIPEVNETLVARVSIQCS